MLSKEYRSIVKMEAGRGKLKRLRRYVMTLHKLYGVWQVTSAGPAEQAGQEELDLKLKE